jgi:hypothetical protein
VFEDLRNQPYCVHVVTIIFKSLTGVVVSQICTELLYQPLTLLDCLHTFCGSCLKEWFSWQAQRPRTSRTSPRYTCPSCRAAVRETRPNATVTTLLDMFLQANPGRARPKEEKEEIAKKYKPGDRVLPAETSAGSSAESDEEERLLLEEIRTFSLRDAGRDHGSRQSSSHTRETLRGQRARSADSRGRSEDDRVRRRREEERRTRRQAQQDTVRHAAHAGDTVAESGARRIEHQASLRSLLSSSDVETTTQDEIVRQIIDEGLLDGIDLDNLDQAQEEELSDRLVQIYLSRHPDRANLQRRSSEQAERPPQGEHRRSRSQTVQAQSAAAAPIDSSRHPPVSRPHLLEATNSDGVPRGHRRRASDQESRRRRTSPTPVSAASSSEAALRPAARSSSDITSHRPRPSPTRRPRTRESLPASVSRHATDPEGRISDASTGSRDRNIQTTRQVVVSPPSSSPTVGTATERLADHRLPADVAVVTSSAASNQRTASSRPGNTPRVSSARYPEPSISCARCGRANIQYDLHRHCPRCQEGKYYLCLHCYRLGRGCLHWFGFGSSAQANFEKQQPPSSRSATNLEPPHVLLSQRYRRPEEGRLRVANNDGRQMTNDDPANRLEEGMFCDICQSLANDCFWQCSQCNDGEWRYCRRCVNQGRCCTHALLPIRREAGDNDRTTPSGEVAPISLPTSLGSTDLVSSYHVLSFSTKCDICTYPIPPTSTRFHCLECNEGDYDICTNCYLKLVASGKISKENGHNGWRRCLKGHRMIVIGFEDHHEDGGQRRVIVRDLVGGHTFKDEYYPRNTNSSAPPPADTVNMSIASPELGSGDWSWKEGQQVRRKKPSHARSGWTDTPPNNSQVSSPTTTSPTSTTTMTQTTRRSFPPDGGAGLVLCALWSYYPEEGVRDELCFPRGAEITEAENINDEWYWGYYAGATGLFPGAYTTVVREVLS